MSSTIQGFDSILHRCMNLFTQKAKDYGTAWRALRLPSITDQIYIKVLRIRTIQEKGIQKVDEPVMDEFIAIINYALMALIQMKLTELNEQRWEIPSSEIELLLASEIEQNRLLLTSKNHDYGEAWRSMRIESITDILLMKVLRTKKIEDIKGKTIVSEGVDANYRDMINYSVFALLLHQEQTS